MLSEDISNQSMPELFELLMTHTTKLLTHLNHRSPDGMLIYQEKADVQLIQSMIIRRKSELKILPLSPVSRF